tara:strand:+ start:174 stop:1562 length:1389 start_codon:yes stop_codon:yes gene_type:complete
MRLAEEEIKQRLVELRNLRVLHTQARERIVFLETENKQLKERIKELESRDIDKDHKIEAMNFQLEQIKIKLFGKKPISHTVLKQAKKIRDTQSYTRSIPKQVTETKCHSVTFCFECNVTLMKKWSTTFYEEDIPLPIQKNVVKHVVEVGYCTHCRKQSSGIPIPSKKVVLGETIKKYICVLSINSRLSHVQIQEHLRDIFNFDISIGEIGNILQTQADELRPEYQQLKQSVISQQGTHYDETSWKVQKEAQGKFAWVATGTENNDTVFSLGQSRGKGNITDIGLGNVGISDDYGAYKNAFTSHQLCWAHPQRKLRDLSQSEEFEGEKKKVIQNTFTQFGNLYHTVQKSLDHTISPYLQKKWKNIFDTITESNTQDPAHLSKIKTSLKKNKEKYFTFLKYPGIPIDNNKAERALRHLVIKRKTSFGSKTQRGAETTSILASVILSLKWNDPEHWFKTYLALRP